MARVKYLYGIQDCAKSILVYVGQTFHPRQRFKEHLRGPLEVDAWMRDQISSGNMPELVVLDRATRDYNTRERELIAQARRQNEFILNRK
jgi:hypothetical protein